MSGVMCERKLNVTINGKLFMTVVRPGQVYGAVSWALKKAHEKTLEVAEMRMLRWPC